MDDETLIQDLIKSTVDKKPADLENAFSDLIVDRLRSALDARREEMLKTWALEPSEDEEEHEYEDDEDEEYEEYEEEDDYDDEDDDDVEDEEEYEDDSDVEEEEDEDA